MPDLPQVLVWLFGQLVVGAAIWGGIRAEIRGIHRQSDADRVQIAATNTRLDRHIDAAGLHPRVSD